MAVGKSQREGVARVSAIGNIRWASVVAGSLVAFLAGLLLSPAVRGLYDVLSGVSVTPSKFTAGLVVVSILSGFLAYLLGGYVAGRFARRAGGANGAMTAVLGAAVGTALGSLGVASPGGLRVATMGLGSAGLAFAVLVVVFFADLFGGYVGGKLGEPSESGIQRTQN